MLVFQRRKNRTLYFQSMGSRMSYSARDGAVGSGIKKCLDSGVTVGARDANTGVLAGVRLSYIQTEADSSETKFTNEFEVGLNPALYDKLL